MIFFSSSKSSTLFFSSDTSLDKFSFNSCKDKDFLLSAIEIKSSPFPILLIFNIRKILPFSIFILTFFLQKYLEYLKQLH